MTQVLDRIRNGVDSAQMYGTLDAIKDNPALGIFQFRAHNHWIDGAHNRSTIMGFYGAGAEDTSRTAAFELDAGEPEVLLGANNGPNPVEYLLHALAACLTISIAYVAAARGVALTSIESRLAGDLDARGAFGLSGDVRNGFEQIHASFRVTGDAPEEKLREVVERARARSAVYDILTNGVPVAMEVTVG